MRKLGYGVFLIVLVVAFMFPFYNVDKQVDMKVIKDTIKQYGTTQQYKIGTQKDIRKYYLLEENAYDDMQCYLSKSIMDAEEICVFKVSNATKRKNVLNQAKIRMENKLRSFKGYGAKQSALIEKGSVFEKGEYVFLIVSDKATDFIVDVNDLF